MEEFYATVIETGSARRFYTGPDQPFADTIADPRVTRYAVRPVDHHVLIAKGLAASFIRVERYVCEPV